MEEALLREFLSRRQGRITFLITHRLSQKLAVDQVLLLESGRLVQSGTPEALLSASGLYRNLVQG